MSRILRGCRWLASMGFLLSILALVACGAPAPNGNIQRQEDGATFSLAGSWRSDCYLMSADQHSSKALSYAQDSYTFFVHSYTLTTDFYSDGACHTPNGRQDNYFGDYKVGKRINSDDGVSAHKIQMTRSSPDWPDNSAPQNLSRAFRVEGTSLVFGYYADDLAHIDYTVRYIQQPQQ